VTSLRVVPIVEGHGEVEAVPILLRRIGLELPDGQYIEVLKPIRWPRSKLMKHEELRRAVGLAVLKLAAPSASEPRPLVLILLDAHEDCPRIKAPQLLKHAHTADPSVDVACVLANVEYETWFVAAAESLGDFLSLPPAQEIPPAPEATRSGKGWVDRHFKGTKYSETVDQPAMTARMDLSLCRKRSPSFDKLCRELEHRTARGKQPSETDQSSDT